MTINDLIIPKCCPIIGIDLFMGNGKIHDNSPAIDRIDNNRGYTVNDIQIISNLANRMKNSASPEILCKFAEWVERTIKETK